MATYLYLINNDVTKPDVSSDVSRWKTYIEKLSSTGNFVGGAPLGGGRVLCGPDSKAVSEPDIGGYMVCQADDTDAALALLEGCPAVQAGGSVEVRVCSEM